MKKLIVILAGFAITTSVHAAGTQIKLSHADTLSESSYRSGYAQAIVCLSDQVKQGLEKTAAINKCKTLQAKYTQHFMAKTGRAK